MQSFAILNQKLLLNFTWNAVHFQALLWLDFSDCPNRPLRSATCSRALHENFLAPDRYLRINRRRCAPRNPPTERHYLLEVSSHLFPSFWNDFVKKNISKWYDGFALQLHCPPDGTRIEISPRRPTHMKDSSWQPNEMLNHYPSTGLLAGLSRKICKNWGTISTSYKVSLRTL